MLGKITMKRAILGIALAIGGGFLISDSWAAGAVAHAEMKGSFARIMITGDTPVRFQSERQGNKLKLRFSSPGPVNLSSITSALSPYVSSATMDGNTAILSLNGSYSTRQFISGDASGIDLMDLNTKAPQPPATTAKQETVTPAEAKVPQPVPAPVAQTESTVPAEPLTMVRPASMPWQKNQTPNVSKLVTAESEPVAAPPIASASKPAEIKQAAPGAVQPLAPKNMLEAKPYAPSAPVAQNTSKEAPLAGLSPSGASSKVEKPIANTEKLNPQAKQVVESDSYKPVPVSKPVSAEKPVEVARAEPKPEPKLEAKKPAEKVIEVAKPVIAEAKRPELKKPEMKTEAKKAESAQVVTKEAPKKEEKKVAEPAATEKTQDEPKEALKETKPATLSKNAKMDAAKQAIEAASEDDEEEKEEKTASAKKPSEDIPDQPVNPVTGNQAGDLVVTVDARKIAAEFYFPWKERVASAAFFEGDNFYIVFNKPARVDTEMLKTILPNFVESVVQMPVPGHTVLRMKTSTKLSARVRKNRESYTWVIGLSRRSSIPTKSVIIETNTLPPTKPNIFLPVLEAAKPAEIVNAENGETLMVVPIYDDGVGVFPERNFVDVAFPRTAQGVAMVKKNGLLRVSRLMNGLRVSAPQGLLLSKDLPKINLQDYVNAEDNSLTFFPYSLWKTDDYAAFDQRRKQLLKQITQATDDKASFYRLSLAQLYMGAGLHHEALALLNLIKQTDPDFYESYQLAALRGAANFMAERYSDAALDFADESLDDQDEIEFWKNTTALMLGTSNKGIRYTPNEKQYIRNYPPDMRQKLAIIAADQMLSKKRYNTALSFLNQLATDKLLGPVKEYSDALIGRIYFDMNKYDLARKMFEPLIDKTKDRFVRSTAQFYMASIDYQENKIDRKELIKRLDRLRMVWRGDSLEPSILNTLGDLYVQENDYISALRSWRELVRNYPNNPNAQDIYARMATTFVQLFDKGLADKLPPIEALAIYYEFRDLTPVDATGDHMIQNLADRLASVDLLDRAANLLEHQVTYRLEKEDRSRVGARLAMIYLLNKEPEKAVDALQRTGYGNNPRALEIQRNQIAATAYSQTGDGQTALALIRNDKSADAKDIRMDVYWNGKDWTNVIASGENILANRSDITAPLTARETQTLLRLAIAYSFTRDTLQLQYLRDYFSPLIQDPQRKEAFTFITSNLEPLDNRNITQLSQQLSDVQNFIQNYRVRVNQEGLSKAVN
ncbi:MAG: hypothetical protein U1E36_08905 [Rickettsiales bacterium]